MAEPQGVTEVAGNAFACNAGADNAASRETAAGDARAAWDDDEEVLEVVKATPEQLAVLNRGAARTLLRAIVVQVVAAVAVGLVAWVTAGVAAGVSALVGASAYMVPSVLFALRLLFGMVKPQGANPATFFFGEFFKLGSTALLLGLAVKMGQDELVWPALLAGLVVALKSHYWLLLFKES